MDNLKKDVNGQIHFQLVSLLRLCIKQENLPQPLQRTQDELDSLLKLAKKHEVQPMAAYGLLLSGGLTQQQEKRCREIVYQALLRQERMERELKRTCDLLEAARIPHMPLKGAVIRRLYPEPWMRTSGDLDILVRDADAAANLLVNNGYAYKEKSSHDVTVISPGGIVQELHFQLIDTDPKASSLLDQVWDHVFPREGTCYYEMEPEIFYFFHIAHMVKHLVGRGCGIRFFVDLWLMTEKIPMDPEKKNGLLQQGGLLTFAQQAERLSRTWFAGEQTDPILRELESFVLNNGVFGTKESTLKLNRAKTDNEAGYFLRRILKPYSKMVIKYPELKKYPVLLPVFWIRRLAEYLLNGKKRCEVILELERNKKLDDNTVIRVKRLFQELELL